MAGTYTLRPRVDKEGTINTEAELKEVIAIIDQFNSAALNRQSLGMDEKFVLWDDYYEGDIHNIPEYEGDPCSNTNIVKPLIESAVGDLVTSPFEIEAEPTEPSDDVFSGEIRDFLSYIYKLNKPFLKLDMAERWRRKYGGVLIMTGFDPKALNGFGMPYWEAVHPENFFPDPQVTRYDELQDGDFHIIAKFMSIRKIKEIHGKRAKYVYPDTQYSYNIPVGGRTVEQIFGDVSGMALYLIYFFKDEEGKLGMKIVADSELLYSSEWDMDPEDMTILPIYENNKYPLVYIPRFIVDGQLWGSSDIKEVMQIEDDINDFDDQIKLNAKLTGNNQYVVGRRAKINLLKWTAKPGLKIPAVDERAVNQLQPRAIPYYIVEHRNRKKEEAEYITGRVDVLEGRNAAGVRTASGIMALQEQANKKVKHTMTMFETGMSEVMNLMLDYCLQFYDEYVPIRMTQPNESEEVQSSKPRFKWVDTSQWKKVNVLIPKVDTKTSDGSYELENMIDKETGEPVTRRLNLDVTIRFATGLDNSPSFLYQSTIDLHRENIITTEEARYILRSLVKYPKIDPAKPIGEFYDQTKSRMRQEEMLKQANIQSQLDELAMKNQQLQQQMSGMGEAGPGAAPGQPPVEGSPIGDRTGFMDNTQMGDAGPRAGIFQQLAAALGGRDV